MSGLIFDREFDPQYGKRVDISSMVARVTANNPGPFTFAGTNTFLVGQETLAMIDPGPLDDAHFQHLLSAIDGRRLTHIFITHTHMDHSPLARRLKEVTGASIYAEGPHRTSRKLQRGELNPLDSSSDYDFKTDHFLKHGDIIDGGGWTLEAVLTPGHAANHTAYFLQQEKTLFSGDHVMAWSTSIVAPPDGSMRDYMASLDLLIARKDAQILPAHGPAIPKPQTFLKALRAHRLTRRSTILDCFKRNTELSIEDLVTILYEGLDPKLFQAAKLSVFAHIEELIADGQVTALGGISLNGRFCAS